jgi:hypothetical protein
MSTQAYPVWATSAPVDDYYLRGSYPTVGHILRARRDLQDQHYEINQMLLPLAAQYDARQWSRVFLVDNDNGHAHSHTSCRNCYPTTRYLWITEMSGATDEQVVEAAGERTCLTCYPSVRAEILAGRPCRLETREGRDERIARKKVAAEKKAAKIAKGVTPDGSALHVTVDRVGYDVKTERAAELRYIEWSAEARSTTWRNQEECDSYRDGAAKMLEALAWKRNTTPEALAEELAPKVTAKVKRKRGY